MLVPLSRVAHSSCCFADESTDRYYIATCTSLLALLQLERVKPSLEFEHSVDRLGDACSVFSVSMCEDAFEALSIKVFSNKMMLRITTERINDSPNIRNHGPEAVGFKVKPRGRSVHTPIVVTVKLCINNR